MTHSPLSRRDFLEKSIVSAVGAGVALNAVSCTGEDTSSIIPVKLAPGEKLRLGIFGCGARSPYHIEAINHYEQMEIAALCDILPEKLEEKKQLVQRGKPALYTDYQDMLKREDIHAVIVLLPNPLHKMGSVACFEAGKHVLCEKPLSMNVTECMEIINAAEKNQKALQVGTQGRHSTDIAGLVKMVHEGLVGNVLSAWIHSFRIDWRKLDPDPVKDAQINWRMQQDLCGGIIFEEGIHYIDLYNWMINSEPVEVACFGGLNNMTLEKRDSWDHAMVIVRYDNDVVLTYGGNLYSCGGPGPNILFGDKATMALDINWYDTSPVKLYTKDYWRPYGKWEILPEKVEDVSIPAWTMDSTILQTGYFYDVCLGKKPPFPSGREHLKSIQISRGAIMAMEERRYIKTSEVV